MKYIYIGIFFLFLYNSTTAQNSVINPNNYHITEYRSNGILYKSVDAGVNRVPITAYKLDTELPEFTGSEIAWITPITDNTIEPIYLPPIDLRQHLSYNYSTILSDGSLVACYGHNALDGWVMKRINPEDGTILWSQTISKNKGGIRGYPSCIYQSSNNSLELLWHEQETENFTPGVAPSYLARTTLQIEDGEILSTIAPKQEDGGVRYLNFGWPGTMRKQIDGNRFLVAETYLGKDIEDKFFAGRVTITDENGQPVADSILLYTETFDIDYAYFVDDVQPTADGGFLVEYFENHKPTVGELDIKHVAKINTTGDLEWIKNVSELGGNQFSIYPLEDNRFFLAGTWDFDPAFATAEFRPFLSLYDAEGNLIWHKTYRDEGAEGGAIVGDILETKKGIAFAVVENWFTKRKVAIYESDMEGNLSELARFEPIDEELRLEVRGLQELDNGDFLAQITVLRDTVTYDFIGQEVVHELRNLYVIKIEKDALFTDIDVTEQLLTEIQISPNPARSELSVHIPDFPLNTRNGRIELHNTIGQRLLSVPVSEAHSTLNVADLPRGLYLLRVVTDNLTWAAERVLIE